MINWLSAEGDETKVIPPTGTNRKPYVELETDDDGHPVLPNRDEWPKKGIDKKALIRSYVVVAYREYAPHMFALCTPLISFWLWKATPRVTTIQYLLGHLSYKVPRNTLIPSKFQKGSQWLTRRK
jgi:hypothetical protein